ncbi:hypothetical protein EGH67_20975 [Klebsiella aerogenes]|nr:hypothetical protein EGH60_20900 [Klebsiella aerogenes]RSV68829.1 hypothetical protein EGH59_17465 [Klebsiella aerogenes]RSV76957.1 hypothetical protein EGH58_16115 [Klebsiella aerogenes]RSV97990.1 hypothetical protein EGH54_20485 [Klebsiella aerogenes]RSV99124.1 hypothetical protein EGH52_22090 [Klebsiella aerogenes]
MALCLPGLQSRSPEKVRSSASGKHPARPPGSLTSVIPITLIALSIIVLINYMDYLSCVMTSTHHFS